MKLKYVGLKKDGETAFSDQTKVTWYPGSSHDIDDTLAKRMLTHPDVFAVDEAKSVKVAPPVAAPTPPANVQRDPKTGSTDASDATVASITLAPGAPVAAAPAPTAAPKPATAKKAPAKKPAAKTAKK